MTARRASLTALASVGGAVALLVLLVWAAVAGPSGLFHGTPHDGVYHAPEPTAPSSSEPPPSHAPPPQLPPPATGWWAIFGFILRWAVRALFVYLILRFLWWLGGTLLARRRPRLTPVEADFDVLDSPQVLAAALADDASTQLDLLTGGSPRNAIVAAWDRFEDRAELLGAARRPWETSSEFTLRLLAAVSADSGAVARLERLYHEARFSEHAMGEDRRTEAIEALEAIHASLAVTSARGSDR